jgi:hypothetical protein
MPFATSCGHVLRLNLRAPEESLMSGELRV